MLDHKDVLSALVRSMNGQNAVYVRETNFGYVIRSDHAADNGAVRTRMAQFVLAALVAAALAVWVVPNGFNSFALNMVMSLICLAAGFASFVVLRTATSGTELHVDVRRRELRSAVVTGKGESWIRSSARFDDVRDVFLRRTPTQADLRSLCVRVTGEDEMMPVAVGTEKLLLSVHDRLMRDLQPAKGSVRRETTLSSGPTRRPAKEVFPQLGPDEQRA